jgi:hypothetical protein
MACEDKALIKRQSRPPVVLRTQSYDLLPQVSLDDTNLPDVGVTNTIMVVKASKTTKLWAQLTWISLAE